jgi:hypothetical protein
MNFRRLATAILFAGIAVAIAQGFALPQAVFCARDAIGTCAERYLSILTGFVGASLFWALVLAGIRWLSERASSAPQDRLLWFTFGGAALAIIAFVGRRFPYHEVIAISAIPMMIIGAQESVWQFEPRRGPGKPVTAGAAWAFLSGASAYLISGAILQWSPRAAEIWWFSSVRVGNPSDALAGPAFCASAVVAFIVFLLKPAPETKEPGDLLSFGVILAGFAVFWFSVILWVQIAVPFLFEDPVARSVASAFATPGALVFAGTVTGFCALIGAVAAFRRSPLESVSLLFFGGPIISIAVDHLAREWLVISGAYPYTGSAPHPASLALLAVSRALWIYPFIGYFIAVRARERTLFFRWLPSLSGLILAALALFGMYIFLHTEASDHLRFQIDYFRLREDFALLAVPIFAAGWLLPSRRTVFPARIMPSRE